jgi:hypothetical protein
VGGAMFTGAAESQVSASSTGSTGRARAHRHRAHHAARRSPATA